MRRQARLTTMLAAFLLLTSALPGQSPAPAHPDYARKVAELLGRNVFQIKASPTVTLSIIGTQKDIRSGNYLIGSALEAPGRPDATLHYLAEFTSRRLSRLWLSDGRILTFEGRSTGDFVLTLRGTDPGFQRQYAAVYRSGALARSTLQLGPSFVLEYDDHGHLTRTVLGTGSQARAETYDKDVEVGVGVPTGEERYSATGRRLAHSQFMDSKGKPEIFESDTKQVLLLPISVLEGEKLTSLTVSLDDITKVNTVIHVLEGRTLRITTKSDVLGQIVDFRREELAVTPQSGQQGWVLKESDWRKYAPPPNASLAGAVEKLGPGAGPTRTEPAASNPPAPATAGPADARGFLERGLALREKGELDKAIAEYDRAIELAGDTDVGRLAFHNRANCRLLKGDFDQAIADYSRALEIGPHALTSVNRGIAFKRAGRTDDARRDFLEAVKLDPLLPDPFVELGDLDLDLGKHDQAVGHYDAAIRNDPANARTFGQRGLAFKRKGDDTRAAADFTEAVRLDPKYAWAYFQRAVVRERQGQHDQAIEDCTAALRLDPEYGDALGQRGIGWTSKKDYDQAISDFTSALRLEPQDDSLYHLRGKAWLAKKNPGLAVEDFSRALQINPRAAAAYVDRGVAWNALKAYDKEIEDYSTALQINPRSEAARFNRGLAWMDKGDAEKAIADFSEAVELNPTRASLHWMLARALAQRGNDEQAHASNSRALELEPTNASYWSTASEILERLGRLPDALESARQALARQPENPAFRARVATLEAKVQSSGVPPIPRDAARCPAPPVFASTSPEPVLMRYRLPRDQVITIVADVATDIRIGTTAPTVDVSQHLRIDVKARVTEVDPRGNLSVLAKITRLQMKMTGAAAVEYDSDQPRGTDADFQAVAAMIGVGIPCRVSPVGEMLETDLEPLRLAARRANNAALRKAIEDGASKMFEGTFVQLSTSPIAAGQTYVAGTMLSEQMKTHVSYRVVSVNGEKTRVVMTPILSLEPAASSGDGAQMRIATHESSGWLLFDLQHGYVPQGTVCSHMVVDASAEGRTVRMDVTTRVSSTSTLN